MAKPYLLSTLVLLILFSTSCKKDTQNILPTTDAGASQTITLPVESVTLTGEGKDVDGRIVTYLWAQVSGPSASIIVDPGASSTVVQGLTQGTYVFQLSVWDNLGGIATDTTVITVNPSVNKNITLQPNNNPYEFSINLYGGADASGLTQTSLETTAWTIGGTPIYTRGLVKFDLSTIPSTATITAAHLYLYSNPTPNTGNQIDANYADNAFSIQQVATSWSTSNLTWTNQPGGLTSNQIIIPTTSQPRLDLDVDVTAQVASMVNSNTNYGFLLKLQNEVIYTSRIFIGSHNSTYTDKHPKLVVDYK